MPEPDAAPDVCMDRAKPGLIEVALLHDLTRWRQQLARSIARNNLALHSEEIATAVNQIICRLLFLRIAEDRCLIDAGTFQQLSCDENAYPRIISSTQTLDDLFLDLFPPVRTRRVEQGGLMADLVIEESVIKKIVDQLSVSGPGYDFASVTTEAIAEVFGQYLRQTVRRSAAHQADIVDTHDTVLSRLPPEPSREIIDYMVQSTLQTAIANRSRREVLPLRIVDPACGAGQVLLCMFGYLAGGPGGSRYTFEERRQVLAESVHGIDTNPHAVAMTRLLLFFKLCESENTQNLADDFFRITRDVLQELCSAIRCGNALIGPDIVRDESWAFCPARERHHLNAFAWQDGFPEIFAAGGFDVVIGNPPDGSIDTYEWIQQYFQRHYAVYDLKVERSAYFIEKGIALLRPGGTLGYCMGDRWLRGKEGTALRSLLIESQLEEIVDFAVPEEKKACPGLCLLMLTKRLPSRPLMVALANPGWPRGPTGPGGSGMLAEYIAGRRFPVDPASLDAGGWALRDTRSEAIVAKVQGSGTTLADYVMDQIFPGTAIAADDPLVIDEATKIRLIEEDSRNRSFIRPLVSGDAIGRYSVKPAQRFVIVIPLGWTFSHPAARSSPWRWFKRRHPALARFLKQRAGDDRAKLPGIPEDIWWERADGHGIPTEKQPRIFFPGHFEAPAFAYDERQLVPDETTGVIISSSAYLAGILNSRLIAFVFRYTLNSGMQRFYTGEHLMDLPIYTPDFEKKEDLFRHDRIAALVVRMTSLNRELQSAKNGTDRERLTKKIAATDKVIDSLVYELYGMTKEEVAVVEELSTPGNFRN